MDCQYANACQPHHALPFTGLDLVAVVFLAVAIILCGLILRLSSR